MARKTSNQIRADIQALLPDNVIGEISPSDVRTLLDDIVDSFTPGFGALSGDPGVLVALTAVPTILNIFDAVIVTSPELVASSVSDNIIAVNPGFYQFSFNSSISGGNNQDLSVTLFRNGVATIFSAQASTSGVANSAEINFVGYTQALGSGDVFDMRGTALSGDQDYTFVDSRFIMNTVQTNT